MIESSRPCIRIDLNEFKLHLRLRNKTQLTLHFNSPSRKFYLSVIALVVNEMKKSGKIRSVSLQEHLDLLALLNESVGDAAGSSEKENLLPRIYRKWKNSLPNLEEAPLFKILGRKKEEGDGTIGKTYSFSDSEKDGWANLFEYLGSEENVRVKFAIDKIGIGLDETEIVFEGSRNGDGWDRFISSLKKTGGESSQPEMDEAIPGPPPVPFSPSREGKFAWLKRHRWIALIGAVAILSGVVVIAQNYLRPTPIKAASIERMQYPLPDKPSIAVLPFVNLSEDPKQEFFSDGLTEEVITALSKSPHLFVIARNSAFTFKGKPVRVDQVAEQLGVRYVLEGSVRREANRVRITAQFIDALKGHHLWAERYDREMKDVLTLQDEIALKIMTALHLKLQRDDARVMARGVKNLDAYLKAMEGWQLVHRGIKEDNALARNLGLEAVALDPNYARGFYLLATTCARDVWLGTAQSPKESWERAIEITQKAIGLDPADDTLRSFLAYLYAMTRQWDKGFPEVEKALALQPNSPEALYNLGTFLFFASKPEEAIPIFKESIRLNPFAPAGHFRTLSGAYCQARRHEEAIEMAKVGVQRAPESFSSYLQLAAVLSVGGREEEARAAAAQVLKINPKFSVEQYAGALAFRDRSHLDYMVDALRRAGLK
jgi:TolB-like protein/Flp pilus assembly protein TadD